MLDTNKPTVVQQAGDQRRPSQLFQGSLRRAFFMGNPMSLEASLFALLGPLVSGRCYPDVSPDKAAFPLIIYQQVGGGAVEYIDQTMADKDNARMQVVVWAKTRAAASALAHQVREAIIGSGLQAQTLVAPVSLYEQELKLYGSRVDFTIWYTP